MGALRLGRGLGRGHQTRRLTARAQEQHDFPPQPDRPVGMYERSLELCDAAADHSSASDVLAGDDEMHALVARIAALEGALADVRRVAEAAATAAAAAAAADAAAPRAPRSPVPAGAQTPPRTPPQTPPRTPLPISRSSSLPHVHPAECASLVCGMPGAHEPRSVARRRLPPAPSPVAPAGGGAHQGAAVAAAAAGGALDVLDARDVAAGAHRAAHSPLHWEVRRFVDANDELVRRQAQLRQYALGLLSHDICSAWPCAQLRLYGSLATGLCSPASDIDVALVHAPPVSAPQLLLALHALLQGRPHVAGAQLLPNAEVPILKLSLLVPAADAQLALVDVDISVCCAGATPDEHYNHQGLAAVGPVRAALRELPALRSLTICLKHYLAALGLNQTYTGGLCAHAVLLLVRAYLQDLAIKRIRAEAHEAALRGSAARPSVQEADPDLGAALLGLLNHYADFDFARTQVCWADAADWAEPADGAPARAHAAVTGSICGSGPAPGCAGIEVAESEPIFRPRPPLAAARGYPPPPLVIDAIRNPTLNVGSKAFAIGAVSAALGRARDELSAAEPIAAPGVFYALMRLGSGVGSGLMLPPPPPPRAPPLLGHDEQHGPSHGRGAGRALWAQAGPARSLHAPHPPCQPPSASAVDARAPSAGASAPRPLSHGQLGCEQGADARPAPRELDALHDGGGGRASGDEADEAETKCAETRAGASEALLDAGASAPAIWRAAHDGCPSAAVLVELAADVAQRRKERDLLRKARRAARRAADLGLTRADGGADDVDGLGSSAGGAGAGGLLPHRPPQQQVQVQPEQAGEEWRALHEGALRSLRARLDAHVATSDEREAARCAELGAVKALVARQLRSVRDCEQAMNTHAAVITREVVRCTNAFTESRLEQAKRAMLASIAARVGPLDGAAGAPVDAPAEAEADADSQLEQWQCTVPVRVYDAEAGQRRVIGMMRLSDALRLTEASRREAEGAEADAPSDEAARARVDSGGAGHGSR